MTVERLKQYGSEPSPLRKWTMRGALGLALVTALLTGCGTTGTRTTVQERQNTTTEEVATNPNQYVGQVVTVRSQPIEKLGPSTFTIEDRQFFGNNPILVVNATGKPFVFPSEGTDIQVTGEVRNFVFADIERDYRLGLDANAYTNYENRPALLARSIAIAPKPGDLTENPGQYYGKPLAVTGKIGDVQGTNVFTLDENRLFGGEDLLVLQRTPANNQQAIQDGETVAVTGVLRPFVVSELERDYNLTLDSATRQRLETEYRNKPVFIAENVYPSAIPDSSR